MATPHDSSELQVALPSDLTAPQTARVAARGALDRWRLSALLDPVLLTVSELVANAVRHGRPPVHLKLRRSGGGVRVRVQDDDATPPAKRAAEAQDESGRGLLLVEAVAAETGVEQVPDDGKVVWAQIDDGPPERNSRC
jgi:anti-sigma regulatory factor (Ser/Thr protein kinase)